jgi:hypothetical protein
MSKDATSSESEGETLGRYERRLVEKYRFALVDIIDSMCSVLNLFRVVQAELDAIEQVAAKKMPQLLPFCRTAREKMALLTQVTPLFLGHNHLVAFTAALATDVHAFDPRPQPNGSTRWRRCT